jgi:hypothetical protein
VAWWFYPSVDPTYRAFPADTVARKESPRLAVTWDGAPIDNLCVSRVALWNAGRQPITQDKLPTSDPLRIVPTQAVRILAVDIANSSRPTLTLDTQIVAGIYVQLSIHGGDAMEKGEGVAVRLLFTGDCKSDFQVAGRVIGSSRFRSVVREGSLLPYFALVLIICYVTVAVIMIFNLEKYLKLRFPFRIQLIQVIIPFLFVVSAGLGVVMLLILRRVAYGPTLGWLPQ